MAYSCENQLCGKVQPHGICAACPWGSRINETRISLCTDCREQPDLYALLFFGMIFLLPISICILILIYFRNSILPVPFSTTAHRRAKQLIKHLKLIDHLGDSRLVSEKSLEEMKCIEREMEVDKPITKHTPMAKHIGRFFVVFLCLTIHLITFIILYVWGFPPIGEFNIYVCPPNSIVDFYSIFLGGGCAYEFAYPFTSLPIAYYSCSALVMVLFYPLFAFKKNLFFIASLRQYYLCLYTYPLLVIGHFFFAGPFFALFPYLMLTLSPCLSIWRLCLHVDTILPPVKCVPRTTSRPHEVLGYIFQHPLIFFPGLVVDTFVLSYALTATLRSFSWMYLGSATAHYLIFIILVPLTNPLGYYDYEKHCSMIRVHTPK